MTQKSHFVATSRAHEKISPEHQHRCSILIEHGMAFFEVKGNFFKAHPMKFRHKIQWWLLRRRDTVESAAVWRAQRLMSGFPFFVQRYEYLATAESGKIHRHVVVLRITAKDFEALKASRYLREIPIDESANRHARARAALFGLSLFTIAGITVDRQIAAE
jgi:hypothetical protein